MRKISKLVILSPYPPNMVGSQRFRFEQYLDLLPEKFSSVRHLAFYPPHFSAILYQPSSVIKKVAFLCSCIINWWRGLFVGLSADTILLHREFATVGPPVLEWILLVLLKKQSIYDLDDAIWLEDPFEGKSLKSRLKWRSKIRFFIKSASKISCGNQYIVDFCSQFNSSCWLIPTTIDTTYHKPDHSSNTNSQEVTIGWTGTHTTNHYLPVMLPVLQKIHEKYPEVRFLFISNKDPLLIGIPYTYVKWSRSTEIEDLGKIDIGLMPLTEDPWSEGKCGFKILQYMAMEIPCVASPVGVNRYLIKQEHNGFLAETEEEWLNSLLYLIQNQEKAKAMGREGRDWVVNHYSKKAVSAEFLSLFDR